jgi:hypothetical protein
MQLVAGASPDSSYARLFISAKTTFLQRLIDAYDSLRWFTSRAGSFSRSGKL